MLNDRVMRRAWSWILPLLTACGAGDEDASLIVERWVTNPGTSCFTACYGFEDVENPLDHCDASTQCGFVPGESLMRIQAIFAEGVPVGTSGELPVNARLYANGRLLADLPLLQRQRVGDGPGEALFEQLLTPDIVPPPADLEVELTVSATTHAMTLASASAEPAPIELRLLADDGQPLSAALFDSAPSPARAVAEANPACRTLRLAVRAPSVPPGRAIALRANAGTFAGGAGTTSLFIEGTDGLAEVPYTLPSEGMVGRIEISGETEASPEAVTVLELLPLPATNLSVSVTATTVDVVGAQGSTTAVTVSGWLHAPEGTAFPAGHRMPVRVAAVAGIASLGCAPILTAEAVGCDPTTGIGGCLLAPPQIPVESSGYFSFDLRTGVCFVGDVTLTLANPYAPPDSAGMCIGDWITTPSPPGGDVTLAFRSGI